jgi:sugar transferase EpsL
MLKRVFDFLVALILLVLCSPVLLILVIMVKFKLGSPIFFKQLRPGLYGKPFYFYKFRTMSNAKDEQGNLLSDAERLNDYGKFLRRYSLDELPQLFNVIRGDLSLVGPRPLLMEYIPLYNKEQARRHEVKPGITGWAQINGRNAISWDERFKLDVWYVDNHSFWLDIKILFLTVLKVIKGSGVTTNSGNTMSLFIGNKEKDKK